MKVFVTSDLAAFAERTRAFLMRRPVEHNVMATVLATHEPTPRMSGARPLAAWVEDDASGEVLGAALRTPPWPMLASVLSADVAEAMMPRLLEVDPGMPGVNGCQPAVSHVAQAWRRHAGGEVEPAMRQAIYSLARVDPPGSPPEGRSRQAAEPDRDLLVDWMSAFNREAGVPDLDADLAIDRRMRDGRLFVWDAGRAVAMAGTGPSVAGVVRLGPVYTPPAERRRGYATALVAAVSGNALAAGADRCMLYADLDNATSNGIYQAVGFERCGEAQEYVFRGGAGGAEKRM